MTAYPCDPALWLATLQYRDRRETFGVSEGALETLDEYLTAAWLYLPLADGGLVFAKTEGLEWLTITKNVCP